MKNNKLMNLLKRILLLTFIFATTLISNLYAQVNLQWAKQFKGVNNEVGTSVTFDANGNVYTVGYFDGTTDFDPSTGTTSFTSTMWDDVFVTKLDASGNLVWAKQFAGNNDDYGQSIAVDASGNVYVTGFFNGTVDFDPGTGVSNLTTLGNNDIFVVKLTPTGALSWVKQIGGTLKDESYTLKIDANLNVIITGTFAGTADFDPGASTANLVSVGSQDIFILKLNSYGNYVWAKSIGSVNYDGGIGVAVDDVNNIYCTGSYSGVADFDPSSTNNISLTPNGQKDVFIIKLDALGNYTWAKSFGGANDDEGNAITVDALGNVITTGYINGTVDMDPGAGTTSITSQGYDIFVSKLSSTGTFVWGVNMGGSSADYGKSIAVDGSGNVFTTGYFMTTADFDPSNSSSNLISKGGQDIFISKLSSTGTFVFAKQFGGTSGDQGLSITLNTTNNIYMTGFFSNTVDFDPNSTTVNILAGGGYDVFILKLDMLAVVTTNTVTNITYTTALCGGNVTSDAGYSVTAKGVCWNTSPNPTIANNFTTDGTGTGAFSSSLTGLAINTTYYVRAYATNSQGTSYGNEVIFTTLTNLPTITTTAISNITATTASSGGNATADGGYPIIAKGICWSTTSSPTIANNYTTDGTGTGAFSSSLTGLTTLTTYYVRAYATNSQGTSYGNQIQFITLTTLPTITTTAVTGITANSATSGGNISSDGGYSVTARGVCWKTSSNPTISDSISSDGTGTGVFASSITGLASSTTYYVRAYATNSQGTAYGNQVTFTSTVGIDDNLFYKYFKIYPDPSNGKFKIESYNNLINSIDIFDITGKNVFSVNNLKKISFEINISNQIDGVYFINVTTNNTTYTTKILITK